jgi:hypothetical protein
MRRLWIQRYRSACRPRHASADLVPEPKEKAPKSSRQLTSVHLVKCRLHRADSIGPRRPKPGHRPAEATPIWSARFSSTGCIQTALDLHL